MGHISTISTTTTTTTATTKTRCNRFFNQLFVTNLLQPPWNPTGSLQKLYRIPKGTFQEPYKNPTRNPTETLQYCCCCCCYCFCCCRMHSATSFGGTGNWGTSDCRTEEHWKFEKLWDCETVKTRLIFKNNINIFNLKYLHFKETMVYIFVYRVVRIFQLAICFHFAQMWQSFPWFLQILYFTQVHSWFQTILFLTWCVILQVDW